MAAWGLSFAAIGDFKLDPPFEVELDRLPNALEMIATVEPSQKPINLSSTPMSRRTLARVDIDFRHWAKQSTDSNSHRLLRLVERACDWVSIAVLARWQSKYMTEPKRCRSFLDRITEDGQWAASTTLVAEKGKLKWSSRVGSDLYAMFEARRMAALIDH